MGDIALADDDKQADLDFDSGFTLEKTPEIPAAKTDTEAKVEAKPEVKPKTEANAPPAETEAEKPPEYVQITKEQFAVLQGAATKTVDLEKQISRLFGTTGDMQQIVKKLQSATPAGQRIKLPKNSFAKMREAFPEIAELLESDMATALDGVVGTGEETKAEATATDPEAVQKLISAALEAANTKREIDDLTEAHPTWREIVGAVAPGEAPNPNHPFRAWLAAQTAEYQAKVNDTNSARVIAAAISKFLETTKTPVKPALTPALKAAAQKDRIKDAVQPRGDGGQPEPRKTEDDEFDEGFRTG